MRIATWNVNSIRARLPRVVQFLERQKPDILCLQETKVQDEAFPREPLEDLGYRIETFGQKTYNGVAILSRKRIEDVQRGFEDGLEDEEERRVIGATVEDVMLLNLYVVNGQQVGAERYWYKLEWMERLRKLLAERYDMGEKLVVTGDFNITFDDRDVHDPRAWHEKILCSTPERQSLAKVLEVGLADALRKFTQEGGHFTWWDFRTLAFKKGWGLRIDHMLLSPPALAACTKFEVDLEARAGEKPSDHAPVIVTIE